MDAETAEGRKLRMELETALMEAESWASLLDELKDRLERHSAEPLISNELVDAIGRARKIFYRIWDGHQKDAA